MKQQLLSTLCLFLFQHKIGAALHVGVTELCSFGNVCS